MPRPPPKTNKDKAKGKARPAVPIPTHFLAIPLELREAIYTHLLQDSVSSLMELLLVNRRTSKEVTPFLYKQPLTFDGQAELFDWLNKVNHTYLRHVADVRFKLHDIDPQKIVGALGKRLRQVNISRQDQTAGAVNTGDNPYHEACDLEMDKIENAFDVLPNIKRLTISPCTRADPRPSPRMVVALWKMLADQYPDLRSLSSYEKAIPVNIYASMPRIKHLRFSGISMSTPKEINAVFKNLRELNHLEVCRPFLKIALRSAERKILADVLHAAAPLRSILLHEQNSTSEASDLLHELFVRLPDAIAIHRPSLRTLKLHVEYADSEVASRTSLSVLATLNSISHFIYSCPHLENLECLDYCLPVLLPRLPATVQILSVRLDRPNPTTGRSLAQRVGTLEREFRAFVERGTRGLRRLVVWLDAEDGGVGGSGVREGLGRVRAAMRGEGVRVSWVPWEGLE